MKTKTIAAALAALLLSVPSQAATVLYTDEAAFLSVLAFDSYLEEFSAYTYGSYAAPSLNLSGGSGFAYTLSAPLNLYSGNGDMSTNSAGDALTATFTGSPVTAVGGLFYATNIDGDYQAGNILVTLNDGTTRSFSPPNTSSFTGFTSDVAITSITIDATSGNWPTMDNFYVGAAVPEPSGLVLCGFGAGALIMLRRRRRE